MPSTATLERILPWLLRLAWVGVAVGGASAIDGATSGRSDPVDAVAGYGSAVVWVIGVAAMAIPAAGSLTASRLIVPLSVPAAVITWVAGASAAEGASFLAAAATASLLVFSGDLGRSFVQASAYGAEDRHLLRPPAAYLLAALVTWSLVASALLAGPLLLAARNWLVGGAISTLAAAGIALGWPRWHRLARRWFVVVPIGVVIHDDLVLAETLMLRRGEISALRLAPADTEALDLTGPAAGHAVEINTTESVTALLGATPSRRHPAAIHLTACLVAPSRPGQTLRAADARRLPVG